MESDFPVLMPALRRVAHLRGVRLLNAKLPGTAKNSDDDDDSGRVDGFSGGIKEPLRGGVKFEPVDTYVKIRFTTKLAGHGEFRSGTFEFVAAPEYGTIYPSWHLNLESSFPTAQAIWTSSFEIDIVARPSAKDERHDAAPPPLPAASMGGAGPAAAAALRVAGASGGAPEDNREAARVGGAVGDGDGAGRGGAAPTVIQQVNPHTEARDEAFVAAEAAGGSVHLLPAGTLVDMSKLIFLPEPKWPDVVEHAETNTLLLLLDDGGGRERWYCTREFGLHLYKKGVLGRVNMRDPGYSMQHEETLGFDSAQASAFQAFLACLKCQTEIAAVDEMREKATQIIDTARPTTSDVSHYRRQLKELDEELERQKLQLRYEQHALRNDVKAYDALLQLTKQAAATLKDVNEAMRRRVRTKQDTIITANAGGGGGSGANAGVEIVAGGSDRALREKLSVSQHLLYARKLRLVAQLRQIYPISRTEAGSATLSINGVELPDSNLRDYNKGGEECICAALGYVGHLVMMLGKYLETSLFFPVKTAGSRSTIRTSRREYPLYRRGINDPNDFANAVKLLKRDIYQLLLAAGIQPPFGRHINADGAGILANLSFLMKRIFK